MTLATVLDIREALLWRRQLDSECGTDYALGRYMALRDLREAGVLPKGRPVTVVQADEIIRKVWQGADHYSHPHPLFGQPVSA